jgi:hypothetical protein
LGTLSSELQVGTFYLDIPPLNMVFPYSRLISKMYVKVNSRENVSPYTLVLSSLCFLLLFPLISSPKGLQKVEG